jgi:acyl-CoA thioesterase I
VTDDERRHFLRYTRTGSWPMLQRFPVSADLHAGLLAEMLGCSPAHVRVLLASLGDELAEAATTMLRDPAYRAAVEALPFRPGDRVVAVGDSITADRLGWFDLLAASIERTGVPGVSLHNLGVSGNTTADVLERYDLLEAARPDRVLVMLGTNDSREHGRTRAYRMASPGETERNLAALLDLIADLGSAVTVITPTAVDQDRITAFFAGGPVRWSAAAVAETAAAVRRVAPACVDLHTASREAGPAGLLEPDGVHLTPAGQRFVLTRIVAHLVSPAEPGRISPGISATGR